ncbi:hypothetical protein WJX74_004133 [Apatococcus lobatus]|uniref:Uncharacterized protein n=1 Tax=Apatococcus lobatus TaxID=904363 RepID=A0AAW1RB58_9CHLO
MLTDPNNPDRWSARRRRRTLQMADNQRRSRRPRNRKEDPDFVFIADADMPRLRTLDDGYEAAVAASLASSRQQSPSPRAKHRAYTSLNAHAIDSKAHHLDPTPFTRELGLLPSCKRRRSVCEAALAQQCEDSEQLHDSFSEADDFNSQHETGAAAAEGNKAAAWRDITSSVSSPEKLGTGKTPLQDASDQSSTDQLLLLSKQHNAAIQLKHASASGHKQQLRVGRPPKALSKAALISRSFRRKGTPHRSSPF